MDRDKFEQLTVVGVLPSSTTPRAGGRCPVEGDTSAATLGLIAMILRTLERWLKLIG
jgi:hypothetical protein